MQGYMRVCEFCSEKGRCRLSVTRKRSTGQNFEVKKIGARALFDGKTGHGHHGRDNVPGFCRPAVAAPPGSATAP